MIYFINCYEFSKSNDAYNNYTLFSGESESAVKASLIEALVNEWGDYSDIDYIDLDQEISSIVSEFNSVISTTAGMDEYDLSVSDPYTDTSRAFDFYNEYVDRDLDNPNRWEFYDFLFNGEFLDKCQNVFPYLSRLHGDTNVHISTSHISSISERLK